MATLTTTLGRRQFGAILLAGGLGLASDSGVLGQRRKQQRRKRRRPTTKRDAYCPANELDAASLVTDGGDRLVAQVFEPRRTGKLVRAQIAVNKSAESSGDWVVQIVTVGADGLPTDEVLATTSVPDAKVPVGSGIVNAAFATPARVRDTKEYGLVLSRPDSTELDILARRDNPCGGRLYSRETEAPTAYSPVALFRDLVYTTFVRA